MNETPIQSQSRITEDQQEENTMCVIKKIHVNILAGIEHMKREIWGLNKTKYEYKVQQGGIWQGRDKKRRKEKT